MLSVSPFLVAVTPRTALLNYSGCQSTTVRIGGLLFLVASITLSKATDWETDGLHVLTLSESARPSSARTIPGCAIVQTTNGASFYRSVSIGTDGKVSLVTTGVEGVTAVRFIGVPVRL